MEEDDREPAYGSVYSITPEACVFGFCFMSDDQYMQLAIELARKAAGLVSPDPMVGAVIVKDGEVVGRGFYAQYGAPHAEVVAIREAGDKCGGAELFTNLEPCCHWGKNPPCTDAILKAGIKRVVSSIHDPNPKVNCGGFAQLRKAGVTVEVGLMEAEASRLNEVFLKYIATGIPYVVLSIAQTADAKIAQPDGYSMWVTSELSRTEVHRMRAQYDAVMVGANTVRVDNPQLTVRHVQGRNPKRIIVAGASRIPPNSNVLCDSNRAHTIIVCTSGNRDGLGIPEDMTVWEVGASPDGTPSPVEVLMRAGRERIASILLEGGSALTTSFLRHKLVDKISIITSPSILGNGVPSVGDIGINNLNRAIKLRDVEYSPIGEDIRTLGYPEWR
jgi:diaminohydroxyphosphoribosylaminopyrimidine deaminase/5-amino-6-(5-phosphoribosylamino)uracil reductase